MPSDPDNKMDELLKSYAKKRRGEAGDPGEMHPATRRLLQAEIAKLRPEPSTPRVPWSQNLLMFWPRLAFAAGVFVALGMATWQLMDSSKKAGFESQLAKHEPAAEKAIPFAEDRESSRDEKEPVRLAKEVDPQSRLEDRVEAIGGLGGREADAFSKQKAGNVAKAEGTGTGDRSYRSLAPSAPAPNVAPVVANKPVMLAEQESRRPVIVGGEPTPQPAPTRPTPPGEARAKDAANVTLVTKSAEALGKNVAANEETKLGLAPASTPINGRDANLSISANNQLSYSVTANSAVANADGADGRKMNNNDVRLPGGVLSPTDAPAQQGLANNASSLDTFYAANQTKAAAGAQPPKLQLNFNDNSGQAFANDRETLLRQNNYDQGAALAAGRAAAPAVQTPPADSKSDSLAIAGAKVATDKAVRELNEAASARADNSSYGNRGVAPGQPAQNVNLYRQRFAQVPLSAQSTAFKKISAPDTKVLSNFEVQRTGGQVRVVDADGSVYDGQVVADSAALAVATDEVRQQVRRSETRTQQAPATQQGAASDPDGQNWAFRVSGTNRTLRQPVSLEGVIQVGQYQNQAVPSQAANMIAQSPKSAANAPQQLDQFKRTAGQAAGPTVAYKEQLSNGAQLSATNANQFGAQRIQGRLRVGPNNQVQLEAVPADN